MTATPHKGVVEVCGPASVTQTSLPSGVTAIASGMRPTGIRVSAGL